MLPATYRQCDGAWQESEEEVCEVVGGVCYQQRMGLSEGLGRRHSVVMVLAVYIYMNPRGWHVTRRSSADASSSVKFKLQKVRKKCENRTLKSLTGRLYHSAADE
jgi:hypothetical protein